MNILFVCTGNTCRSPMAEAILKQLIKPDDGIQVCSGAISTIEGTSASEHAMEVMEELGIDIHAHIAHNINAEILNDADLVLTMTQAHRQAVLDCFGNDLDYKTLPLLQYVGLPGEIADPYGQSVEVYRLCRDQLVYAIRLLYEKVTGHAAI